MRLELIEYPMGVVRDFDADRYLLKNRIASAISGYRNPDPRGLTLVEADGRFLEARYARILFDSLAA